MQESRLTVFEIRVLRRIFGPKRDEVTGEWRRLHKEKRNCTPHRILFGRTNQEEEDGVACST
jgi:hypothetical protein